MSRLFVDRAIIGGPGSLYKAGSGAFHQEREGCAGYRGLFRPLDAFSRHPFSGDYTFTRFGLIFDRDRRLKLRRERHIVKSAVYACRRRSRGPGRRGPGQAGTVPHKDLPGGDFRKSARFPAPGFEFPAQDQILL